MITLESLLISGFILLIAGAVIGLIVYVVTEWMEAVARDVCRDYDRTLRYDVAEEIKIEMRRHENLDHPKKGANR